MKYLFFDIECSNCFNGIGKIVEFGYVLTDENLKIKIKDELVMSPGKGRDSRFNLVGRKGQKDLILSYDYDYYYQQPEFPTFYQKIKSLMEDENTLCFAWSSSNDMRYLFQTCKRYGEKPLKYICYDVQKIADSYLEIKEKISLKKACIKIVGPGSTVKLQEHLSSDDAKMVLMILDALCVLKKVNMETLLSKSKYAKDNSLEFCNNNELREKKKKEIKYNHLLYNKVSKNDNCISKKEEFIGKRMNLSEDVKKKTKSIKTIIRKAHELGYVLVNSLSDTDIFVVYNKENEEKLKHIFKKEFKGKFVLLSQIFENVK